MSMPGPSPTRAPHRTAGETKSSLNTLRSATGGFVSGQSVSVPLLTALQRSVGNQAVVETLQPRRAPGAVRMSPTGVLTPVRALQAPPTAEPAPAVQRHAEEAPIQRHSSWEHALLGDAKPDVLASFGSWQDLMDAKPKKGKGAEVANVDGVGKLTKGNVMHNLAQEMSRLKKWQENPPTTTSTADGFKKTKKDEEYQVVVVALPAEGEKPPLLITYGEMNTLADFYGDFETMKKADPGNRKEIVQSVRKETFLRLKEIYSKLEGSLSSTEQSDADVKAAQELFKTHKLDKASFSGAALPDFISGKAGQADLLAGDKPLIGQGTGAKGETNKYGATLARNACHFVPESWHSWAEYHNQAREKAQESWKLFNQARREKNQKKQEELKAKSAEAANEALLLNGFGDHYLQDSYASGHMLNKTQIMQWYVEYIDRSKEWDYFKDKNWRKVQQMAYRQKGLAEGSQYDKSKVKGATAEGEKANAPRNPQLVETKAKGDWLEQFEALGLQVPASLRTPGSPERQITEFLQLRAIGLLGTRTTTGATLLADGPVKTRATAEKAAKRLILDGVLRTDEKNETRGSYMSWGDAKMDKAAFKNFRETELILREDYVPSDKAKFKEMQAASKKGDDSGYQRKAASVAYGDYFMFMKSAYIQKATNALHDTFCSEGLNVRVGNIGEFFRVYGDDAMFSKESAKGVKFSGETSNMSRDAIINIIDTGADSGISTASILARLPDQVEYDIVNDGEKVGKRQDTIEAWHNPENRGALKDMCMEDVFPKMAWSAMQKFVPGVIGNELGTISKDEKKHGSDAF